MPTPDRKKKCCEKCLLDCNCTFCPCHSPKEVLGIKVFIDEDLKAGEWYLQPGKSGPKKEIQESREGDFIEADLSEIFQGHLKEARTLALQEAASVVRGMKSEGAHTHKMTGCRTCTRDEALEDAAWEIESLSDSTQV